MAVYLRGFLARKMGRGAAELEDPVQESLLAIHLKRETYDTSQLFTVCVGGGAIARYKLIDWFRRNRIRRTEPLDEAAELLAGLARILLDLSTPRIDEFGVPKRI